MIRTTYRLPEAVVEDTKAFRGEVEKFLSGETSADAFKKIGAPMGIYEQREDGIYMVRVRGAAGVFLPHQVKLIADMSRTYGNGIVRATTRQDLQVHGVRIKDIPTILDRFLEAGLSSRGGGGNTVRNISVCPTAGACSDEVFDVTPYALALTEYLIRERKNFSLPRKFKVAFSGCGKDCGLASVTDLGFFAHERDGVGGFSVYAGGGMGAHSALGIQIEEFVPAEVIFEIAEAMKRLFDKHGDRTNRSKARLRFVVKRLGDDAFIQAYREELESVRSERIQFPDIKESQCNQAPHAVEVNLPSGGISADHLVKLADIASEIGDGFVRTTQGQNLQLRVPESRVDDAAAELRALNPEFIHTQSVRCVACAGKSICRLGICLSRGLATVVDAELRDIVLPFDATIRISGCPNSCGHHPIAALGLYGGVSRVEGRLVHCYNIVAGGRLAESNAALAQPIAKVPAKAVPALLKEFWNDAAANLHRDESLDDLMSRWGVDHLRTLAKRYEDVPPYDESPEFYQDFERAY